MRAQLLEMKIISWHCVSLALWKRKYISRISFSFGLFAFIKGGWWKHHHRIDRFKCMQHRFSWLTYLLHMGKCLCLSLYLLKGCIWRLDIAGKLPSMRFKINANLNALSASWDTRHILFNSFQSEIVLFKSRFKTELEMTKT